jgi:hypothetical protein
VKGPAALLVLVAVVIGLVACGNILPASESETFARMEDATDMLSVREPDGAVWGICTAFATRQEQGSVIFATAAHCVRHMDTPKHPLRTNLGISFRNAPPTTLAPVAVLECGDYTDGEDWAIMRVTTNRVVEPLRWSSLPPRAQERLLAVSIHREVGRMELSGVVVAPSIAVAGHPVNWLEDIFVAMPVMHGNSGSPVVDVAGDVVGILIGQWGDGFSVAYPSARIPKKWR